MEFMRAQSQARRDAANRRIQIVELTDAGEEAFERLRGVAMSFDKQLRRGISAEELSVLEDLLHRLAANVGADRDHALPWTGVAEPRP